MYRCEFTEPRDDVNAELWYQSHRHKFGAWPRKWLERQPVPRKLHSLLFARAYRTVQLVDGGFMVSVTPTNAEQGISAMSSEDNIDRQRQCVQPFCPDADWCSRLAPEFGYSRPPFTNGGPIPDWPQTGPGLAPERCPRPAQECCPRLDPRQVPNRPQTAGPRVGPQTDPYI